MKYEEMIKEIYFVAGKLEGLSLYLQRNSSDAVVTSLSDCVDRLEIIGAQLLAAGAPKYTIKGTIKGTISDEDMALLMKQKDVIADVGRPPEAFGRVYAPPEDASDQ